MSEETDGGAPPPTLPPREAIAAMAVHAPSERNRKLAGLLAAANASDKLKARWHAQQVTAQRLGMSDHSWVHLQIVLNSALRIFRLLHRAGVQSAIETDYAMNTADAEVVIAGACLMHDLGMSIHRVDHESFSLFLAADLLDDLLADVYEEPERTIVASEILHAIIGHRKRRAPAHARGRRRPRRRRARHGARPLARLARDPPAEHPLALGGGDRRGPDRPGRAAHDPRRGRDEQLRRRLPGRRAAGQKLRGSGLEDHIEVVARIDAEHEKRLLSVYRI